MRARAWTRKLNDSFTYAGIAQWRCDALVWRIDTGSIPVTSSIKKIDEVFTMNVGDYIYLYLFDLEKTLSSMEQLRTDRFGKIIKINRLEDVTKHEFVQVYTIKLLENNKIIQYRSDNLTSNIASISSLIEIIGRANIDSEKRQFLLEQMNNVLSQYQ